jgi:hypothetical protein
MTMKTPVLFLIFNRPDTTARVFAAIRDARPERLYVAADGPRSVRVGEAELCQATREIATAIDWECELHTLFRERNLGCKGAVNSAITWFFGQEEEGIILEDDCLPHPSFFGFCELMLDRFRNDPRVMIVTGTNFLMGEGVSEYTYFFSNVISIWGWASWRESWCKHKIDRKGFDPVKIHLRFGNKIYSEHLVKMMRGALRGRINTWDIQWVYSIIANDGVSITPFFNQIKNIGYEGAHFSGNSAPYFDMPTQDINLENIAHPPDSSDGVQFDNIAIRNMIKYYKLERSIFELFINRLRKEYMKLRG